jgi:hypothetical protein
VRLPTDRAALDYVRVLRSRRSVVGMPLGSLTLPGGLTDTPTSTCAVCDADLLPGPRPGARVRPIASASSAVARELSRRAPVLRRLPFKGAADFSYISVDSARPRPPRRHDPHSDSGRRPDHPGARPASCWSPSRSAPVRRRRASCGRSRCRRTSCCAISA